MYPGPQEDDNWLSSITVLLEVVVGLNTLTTDISVSHRPQAVIGVHMLDDLVQLGQKKTCRSIPMQTCPGTRQADAIRRI